MLLINDADAAGVAEVAYGAAKGRLVSSCCLTSGPALARRSS